MSDLSYEELAPEEQELLRQLRPIWREARQLENPPADAIARARAIYRQHPEYLFFRPRAVTGRRLFGILGALTWRPWISVRPAFALGVALVLVMLLVFGGTAAAASQDALPGETLYPVKTTIEYVRLALTFSEAGKAELSVTFAQTRVQEIKGLAARGRQALIPTTVAAYEDAIQQASTYLTAAAQDEPAAVVNLAPRIEKALAEAAAALSAVGALAPSAQPALEGAVAASIQAQQAAKQALATAAQHMPTPTATPSAGALTPSETPLATETISGVPSDTSLPPGVGPSDTPVPSNTTVPPATAGAVPTPESTEPPGPSETPPPTLQPSATPVPPNTPPPTAPPNPTATPGPDHTPKPTHTPRPTHTPKP